MYFTFIIAVAEPEGVRCLETFFIRKVYAKLGQKKLFIPLHPAYSPVYPHFLTTRFAYRKNCKEYDIQNVVLILLISYKVMNCEIDMNMVHDFYLH